MFVTSLSFAVASAFLPGLETSEMLHGDIQKGPSPILNVIVEESAISSIQEEKVLQERQKSQALQQRLEQAIQDREHFFTDFRKKQNAQLQRLAEQQEFEAKVARASASFLQVKNPIQIAGDTNPVPYPVVNLNLDEPAVGPLDEMTARERYKVDDALLQLLEDRLSQQTKTAENALSSNLERIVKLSSS